MGKMQELWGTSRTEDAPGMKLPSLIPTTNLAFRFCDIMHRRHTTPWQPKEKRAFKLMVPGMNESDLCNVERRYRTLWPPNRDKNTLRHDLGTLLNNWPGEVDRANIWCEQHPEKKARVVIPMPPQKSEPYIPSTDPAVIAEQERFMEHYRQHKKAKEA